MAVHPPVAGPYDRELQLYRRLGVPRFRKLVLLYARLRHRKTGGRNPAYHLCGLTPAAAEAFLPQLRKNTALHLQSLFLLALYWVLSSLGGIFWPWMVPLSVFLLWLNGSCLLLQRYHWLRIRILLEKHRQRSETPGEIPARSR